MKPSYARIASWFLLALAAPLGAQPPEPAADRGAAALRQSLLELRTTASFLQVTAHPDDEDGGLLTLLARGRGVRTGLISLTRGEGGQNKIGPELFDELGVTRTEELLASGRYYSVAQFFTRAVDYGFSKTLSEALDKWRFGDRDGGPVVADLVRAIRTFRPEVLVARFSGTDRDGHAHHQASAILARKAFEEAGDPAKFPEQLKPPENLAAWKPKKLYIGIFRKTEDWSVSEDVGGYDPLIGESYAQLAWEGLSHQRTQGVGQVRPDAGSRMVYYKRIDGTPLARVRDEKGSIEPPFHETADAVRERGFFDGLDETLTAIGRDSTDPSLKKDLTELDRLASAALGAYDARDLGRCAAPLAKGVALARQMETRAASSDGLTAFLLRIKSEQFQRALNRALAVDVAAVVEPEKDPGSPFPGFRFAVETIRVAVAGGKFNVSVTLVNRSPQPLANVRAELLAPPGWIIEPVSAPPAGTSAGSNEPWKAVFRVTVSPIASPSALAVSRASIDDPLYVAADPRRILEPLPEAPLKARVHFTIAGTESSMETYADAIVATRSIDPLSGEKKRDLAVEPALSVRTTPPLAIVPLSRARRASISIEAEISNNASDRRNGSIHLEGPADWKPSASAPFELAKEKDSIKVPLSVSLPDAVAEGEYKIAAVADEAGRSYRRTVEFIDHADIGSFYFLRPAETAVCVVDVKLPPSLSVGYVVGAEDTIPEVLKELGVEVHLLSSEDLEKGDLSRFPVVVTGPRAYDVREDLRRANPRLIDFVSRGGRLVVQYNQNTRAFNAGNYLPFPAKFPDSNARVTVEDSPVKILEPGDPIWNYPNRISGRDFDGWVQERGLYFLGEWSKDFTPLLEMADPGEAPLRGGLVEARVGKGTWIFTGIAWFRQLPRGVPGALRIFANLISPPAR